MPGKNDDLHGNAPDKASVALILIDVINDLEFPEGDQLLRHALPMADRIADLIGRARRARVPVIYVNDNFGRWQSNFHSQVEHCLEDGVRGRPLVEKLRPGPDDHFVLKPKHSGFFSTTLDILLEYLRAETLILAGVAGNICVLFTANDAYMRDFHLVVPSDCVASNTEAENRNAVDQMERVLKADVRPSAEVDFEALKRGPSCPPKPRGVSRGNSPPRDGQSPARGRPSSGRPARLGRPTPSSTRFAAG